MTTWAWEGLGGFQAQITRVEGSLLPSSHICHTRNPRDQPAQETRAQAGPQTQPCRDNEEPRASGPGLQPERPHSRDAFFSGIQGGLGTQQVHMGTTKAGRENFFFHELLLSSPSLIGWARTSHRSP